METPKKEQSDFSKVKTPDLSALAAGLSNTLKILKNEEVAFGERGLGSAKRFCQIQIQRYGQLLADINNEINKREDFLP